MQCFDKVNKAIPLVKHLIKHTYCKRRRQRGRGTHSPLAGVVRGRSELKSSTKLVNNQLVAFCLNASFIEVVI